MSEKLPKATFGSQDQPLKIGGLEIPCYVLENGKRILVRAGMYKSLGMSEGTGSRSLSEGDRLVKFIDGKRISPYIPNELANLIKNPLRFQLQSGGVAYGYEATLLPDICDAVLTAREENKLQKQQLHIAKQCEILVRGFARIGIIALVDEVTGYQHHRARQALHEILEEFIAKELRAWAKTFPDEFYEELFRLRGWNYLGLGGRATRKRPILVGKLTNDIVYNRLAPGVLNELKRKTPKDTKGRRVYHFHRWLTEEVGHPRLREHLAAVIALMKASTSWDKFKRSLQRALPKWKDTLELPFEDQHRG